VKCIDVDNFFFSFSAHTNAGDSFLLAAAVGALVEEELYCTNNKQIKNLERRSDLNRRRRIRRTTTTKNNLLLLLLLLMRITVAFFF